MGSMERCWREAFARTKRCKWQPAAVRLLPLYLSSLEWTMRLRFPHLPALPSLRSIRLKALSEHSNIPILAQEIVDRCDLINESHLSQVIDLLYELQERDSSRKTKVDTMTQIVRVVCVTGRYFYHTGIPLCMALPLADAWWNVVYRPKTPGAKPVRKPHVKSRKPNSLKKPDWPPGLAWTTSTTTSKSCTMKPWTTSCREPK